MSHVGRIRDDPSESVNLISWHECDGLNDSVSMISKWGLPYNINGVEDERQ